jgi:hypothetical protein
MAKPVMLVKQCHVYHPPEKKITIFIGGMVTYGYLPFPVDWVLNWHWFTLKFWDDIDIS